jgi:hypothetical protein
MANAALGHTYNAAHISPSRNASGTGVPGAPPVPIVGFSKPKVCFKIVGGTNGYSGTAIGNMQIAAPRISVVSVGSVANDVTYGVPASGVQVGRSDRARGAVMTLLLALGLAGGTCVTRAQGLVGRDVHCIAETNPTARRRSSSARNNTAVHGLRPDILLVFQQPAVEGQR